MTWKELCLDRRFEDLPFKIELNGRGQIIMSPTRNFHGFFAARLVSLLEKHLPHGKIIVECAVETADGTKEADVAWLSDGRFAKVRDDFSCSIAPEICIEVMSPSNSRQELQEKRALYFQAGAEEYWLCDGNGKLEFYSATGQLERSALCPRFPGQIEM